jgi:hypothetical protein
MGQPTAVEHKGTLVTGPAPPAILLVESARGKE